MKKLCVFQAPGEFSRSRMAGSVSCWQKKSQVWRSRWMSVPPKKAFIISVFLSG